MKKLTAGGIAALALIAGAAAWYFLRSGSAGSRPDNSELRAMMRDENAPRKMEPSVVIQVNDAGPVEAPAGTPVWVSVNITNSAAANEVAAGRAGVDGTPPGALTLGDARKQWSDAVEIRVRGANGAPVAGWPWKRLDKPGPTLKIDAESGGTVTFGIAALEAAPGEYNISACLGQTGEWKGSACSEAAVLKVSERGEIAPERGARFAFLTGDAAGLENYGRKLLAADRNSPAGLVYVAEASFQRGEWAEALRRYSAARSAYFRQKGPNAEAPIFTLRRISQIREKH